MLGGEGALALNDILGLFPSTPKWSYEDAFRHESERLLAARLRVAGLLATVWIVACSMIFVIGLKDLSSFGEALVCLQFGAALLIPWGLVVQAFAGVAAVLAYLAAMALPG